MNVQRKNIPRFRPVTNCTVWQTRSYSWFSRVGDALRDAEQPNIKNRSE